MSDFIHAREYLNAGSAVNLNCDTQCNFMVMTDTEFNNYRNRRGFTYYGGSYKHFPARIVIPHSDNWNVVIDLGGGKAQIRYSLTYTKG